MFTIPTPIPITINPLFLIVAFFLGILWSGGNMPLAFILMGVVTLSVLIHEFGHAFAGLAFKQKVKISLEAFGGLTERRGKPLKSWQEFVVILMGPIFGFLLYLAADFIAPTATHPLWKQILLFTATANLFWTVLNLLPVLPLDGGQLLRVILQAIWGTKGLKAACILSMVFGSLFALYFILAQQFFVASIFGFFIYESWQMFSSVKFLRDEDSNPALQRLLTKGERARAKGEDKKAHEIFNEVRHQVKEGLLFNHATILLAEMELLEEHPEAAYRLLYPIRGELQLDGLALFHETAMRGGQWEEALEAGSKIFERVPSAQLALANAKAAEKLFRTDARDGWQRAYERFKK